MIGSPKGLKPLFEKKGPCFNGSAWVTQAAHHTDYMESQRFGTLFPSLCLHFQRRTIEPSFSPILILSLSNFILEAHKSHTCDPIPTSFCFALIRKPTLLTTLATTALPCLYNYYIDSLSLSCLISDTHRVHTFNPIPTFFQFCFI